MEKSEVFFSDPPMEIEDQNGDDKHHTAAGQLRVDVGRTF